MKSELILITLLWAVTLNGFAVAVNARGPARVTLSYFFAILCLCAAVFHTSQTLVASGAGRAAVLEAPAVPLSAPAPDPETPRPADTAGLAASQEALVTGAARNEMKRMLDSGRRLVERLSAVDLGQVSDLSDAEYDALQNKAFGFRNEVGKLKETFSTLGPNLPAPLKVTEANLQAAIEDLAKAIQAYDRFFKAENDEEESTRQQAFQQWTQAALVKLRQVESDLSAP